MVCDVRAGLVGMGVSRDPGIPCSAITGNPCDWPRWLWHGGLCPEALGQAGRLDGEFVIGHGTSTI
jgi:hypothetical protein